MNKISLLFIFMIDCIKFSNANTIKPITNFDVNKYLGKWYEIARLPNRFEKKCIVPIMANYSINTEKQNEIIVVNQCNTIQNRMKSATGVAYFDSLTNVGKLKVTFLPKLLRWIPFSYGDYNVLFTDYNVSMVSSSNHKYLWILSRSTELKKDNLNKILMMAKDQGFDIDKLIFNYNIIQ